MPSQNSVMAGSINPSSSTQSQFSLSSQSSAVFVAAVDIHESIQVLVGVGVSEDTSMGMTPLEELGVLGIDIGPGRNELSRTRNGETCITDPTYPLVPDYGNSSGFYSECRVGLFDGFGGISSRLVML